MKAKIIIEDGETTIVLTPSNEFDRDLIEKLYEKKEKHSILTRPEAEYSCGMRRNLRIEILIKEEKQ